MYEFWLLKKEKKKRFNFYSEDEIDEVIKAYFSSIPDSSHSSILWKILLHKCIYLGENTLNTPQSWRV